MEKLKTTAVLTKKKNTNVYSMKKTITINFFLSQAMYRCNRLFIMWTDYYVMCDWIFIMCDDYSPRVILFIICTNQHLMWDYIIICTNQQSIFSFLEVHEFALFFPWVPQWWFYSDNHFNLILCRHRWLNVCSLLVLF